jgi:hypothetical protein
MKKELLTRLAQGLIAGGVGVGGYALGKRKGKAEQAETVGRAKQQAALAKKLREHSESVGRRLKIENYYIRRALNQLAKKYREKA